MDILSSIYEGAKGLISFITSIPSIISQSMTNIPTELATFLMVALGILIAFKVVQLIL